MIVLTRVLLCLCPYLHSASNPILINIEFRNCMVVVSNATLGIVNCVFRDSVNRTTLVLQSGAAVTISNSLFINNSAINGSAIFAGPGSEVTSLSSSIFKSNGYQG